MKGMKNHRGKGRSQRFIDPDEPESTKQFKDRELLVMAMKYVFPYKFQFAMILFIVIINAFVKVYPVTLLSTAVDLADQFAKMAGQGQVIPVDQR
nr:hypothetical protein [Candidatus Sigynarchaeota archaeon]